MSDPVTRPTGADVDAFLETVTPDIRREDGIVIRDMMERVTGCPATMWGPTIIGFGEYTYTYDSGHSGTSMRVGFSPRKAKHSLYFMPGHGHYADLVDRLGKVQKAKSCLYITRLSGIDMDVLEELTRAAFEASAASAS